NGLENYTFNTSTATLSIFKNDPLIFKPGTKYVYSNYGFSIIGAIVESVSVGSFSAIMKQHLQARLGMSHSIIEVPGKLVKNKSRYYMKEKMQPLLGTSAGIPSTDVNSP